MMTGFSGALEIGRLVQSDIHVFPIGPDLTKEFKRQSGRINTGAVVGDDLAIDLDFTIRNQTATPFAGAESLRLQDAVQR